jgi:hypothetical protein
MNDIEKSNNKMIDFDNYVSQLQEIIGSKIELMQMLMKKATEYGKHK